MKPILSALPLLAAALAAPLLITGASAQEGRPSELAPAGNCDLMASNTLRATYVGPVGEGGTAAYRFTVIETIAYKASNRYANLPMKHGQTLDIPADPSRPGQPTDVLAGMADMKPGEEVIMLINHIFLFSEPYYGNQIVCTRLARLGVLSSGSGTGASGSDGGSLPLPPVGGNSSPSQEPYAGGAAEGISSGSRAPIGDTGRGDAIPPLPTDTPLPVDTPAPAPAQPSQGRSAPHSGDDTIIESGSGNPSPTYPDRPILPADEGF